MNTNTQIANIENTGKLVEIAPIGKAYEFVAEKLGLGSLPKSTKENPFTRKMLNALAVSNGKTDVDVKVAMKEFDGLRKAHYAASAVFLGAVAADPRFRKNLRSRKSAKTGNVTWTATITKEKSKSVSKDAEIAQLKALVAKLTAQQPVAVSA